MINVSLLLYWLLQMGVAFLSTITFAIIFHTPRKEWLCCGFTGAVGWLVYVVCVHFGLDVATASFFATLALAWFARVFAFWRKAPVTVFLITGIFPLVPGAGIYYTGYHLFMSDNCALPAAVPLCPPQGRQGKAPITKGGSPCPG